MMDMRQDMRVMLERQHIDADAWERVRFTFADGLECRRCPYKHQERQGHGEVLRMCDLLDTIGRDPSTCPGLL